MTERKGDWAQSFTGVQLWGADPRPEDIFIEDIAHHLSMIVRFGGAAPWPYTVARHSMLVASRCMALATTASVNPAMAATANFKPLVAALLGLLHDAAEFACGDMTRPFARSMRGTEYETMKKGWEAAVWARFNLTEEAAWYHDLIAKADVEVLAAERDKLFPTAPADWRLPFPAPLSELAELPIENDAWNWKSDERSFLYSFGSLWRGSSDVYRDPAECERYRPGYYAGMNYRPTQQFHAAACPRRFQPLAPCRCGAKNG